MFLLSCSLFIVIFIFVFVWLSSVTFQQTACTEQLPYEVRSLIFSKTQRKSNEEEMNVRDTNSKEDLGKVTETLKM
jgi:hypothetical protein